VLTGSIGPDGGAVRPGKKSTRWLRNNLSVSRGRSYQKSMIEKENARGGDKRKTGGHAR